MARYILVEVIRFLEEQHCCPSGDKLSGGIAFETADGHGFTLPVYDNDWIDADLVDDILSNRWIVPCAHTLKRHD
ncbi:hypothetical protein [Afipia clevelandensis]|uniref:hypothetical protein n=1 Tax=Afipia clevelandensis TaxID=1034 RepID=UPI00058F9964|nr:hypothetical protein [Afipia clevelandensis]